MADVKKDVLYQYAIDFGDSAKRIGEITGRIRELKDEQQALEYQMKSLEVGTPKYKELAAQLAANTEAQKAYRKQLSEESRVVQNAIKDNVEYQGSLDGMRARLSTLKTQLGQMTDVFDKQGKMTGANATKYVELQNEIKGLNDNISKQEQAYGVYSRNVGNYAKSIVDALGGIGGKTGQAISGIRGMTTGLTALSKVPVIAILGLLARALEVVIGGLKGSEENANRVSQALSGFKAIADVLTVGLQELGKIVGRIAEGVGNLFRRIVETIPALDSVNERMRTRNELAEREIELNKETRQTSIDVAQLELEISELRAKAADKEQYTASERLSFLNDALEKERAISLQKYELAQQEYELIRDQNAQTESSKEQLDREAAAQVKMLNARKEYYEFERSVQRQMQSARREIAAEEKQQADERRQRDEELRRQTEETAKQVSESYSKVRDALLGDTDGYKIEQIGRKYAEMYKEIQANALMSEEERIYYTVLLEQKMSDEIAAIRKARADKQQSDEEKRIKAEADARKRAYDTELAQAWQSADEQYRIRMDYLQRELQQEELGAQRRAELEREIAELRAGYELQRIDALEQYVGRVASAAQSIVTLMDAAGQRELKNDERKNKREQQRLKDRLAAGIISKEQYTAESERLDEELDAKELEIERRAAQRQKVMSAFQIAIDTATAIMKIWAEVPKFDYGVSTGVLTALAAATGAAQLAAVLAQPLPMARKGGLVQGATHEAGGVLINTENDERIIGANPSRAFPELLNLISYIGKNGSIPNTGYAERQMSVGGVDYDRLAERLAVAMQGVKIYTAITDVRRKEKTYTEIQQSARL